MPIKREKKRCHAKSKQTGEQCRNWAVTGYSVCRFHGAGGRPKIPKPVGGKVPKGNTNARKHGAYSARLPAEDRPLYEAIKAQFTEELGGDNLTASDERLIHQLAIVSTKFDSAVEKGAPPDALNMLNKMILDLLRELKATRASKDLGPKGGSTPAEIMANLLVAVSERKAELRKAEKPKAELPDVEPPFEVVEVADGQSADS